MRILPFLSTIAAAGFSLTVLTPAGLAAKPGDVAASVPDGAITGPMPTLTWNRLESADSYQIQGYDKRGKKIFSMTVTPTDGNCTNRPFCRVVPAMPFPSGPNKWRIRATNEDGSGPWSPYADFWVGGPAVAQTPVAGSGSLPIVAGVQTVLTIEIDVPGPGAVSVSSHGFLQCTRSNSAG